MVSLFGRRIGLPAVPIIPKAQTSAGVMQVVVYPQSIAPLDISVFRGVPTQLAAMDFEDPFGPVSFSFTLPAVTIFDRLGQGDLAWCIKEANVDVIHHGAMPAGYPFSGFAWEGFISTFDWGENGLTLQCSGALHQVDYEKAKPLYPSQPLPYEVAIAHCFAGRPYLRVSALRIEWPSWWKTLFTAPPKGTPSYMIPTGVTNGNRWTGMLTRSTGSWDDLLTGYIQSLLVSMYTERGRWTIDLDPGRAPVLRHRDAHFEVSAADVVINAVAPGVKVSLTEDWTQSVNVLFGQGQSLSGVGYSGMEVSNDGQFTSYVPLASSRQVEPVSDKNGWFQRGRFRRETVLQLQAGLDENDARRVAAANLARFGDPGITGSITLQSDPMFGGQPIPRHLVRAGMTVRLPNVFGSKDGPLFHVARSSHDFTSETTTLTVDSKYRDTLTLDEVRLRGRDALSISRMLVSGTYTPPVKDQLLPWNYATGSGCIPSGSQLNSLRLFKGMPSSVRFPWTEWTTLHPPKAAAWKSCYIRIGPASINANNNWSYRPDSSGSKLGIPIKVAQAADIRLIQVAAYDRDGNVMPVDFHLSLYSSHGINPLATPMMPVVGEDGINYETRFAPYKGGQHYPLFPNAWESYNADGTKRHPEQIGTDPGSGLIRAWGSSYEKAGHWPGSSAAGDPATGLLVDEAPWGFDFSTLDNIFDPYSPTKNLTNQLAGVMYVMIWCDQQAAREVFFAGRIFRVEPGQGT